MSNKIFKYPEEFERMWKSLDQPRNSSRKEMGYKVYLRLRCCYLPPLEPIPFLKNLKIDYRFEFIGLHEYKLTTEVRLSKDIKSEFERSVAWYNGPTKVIYKIGSVL